MSINKIVNFAISVVLLGILVPLGNTAYSELSKYLGLKPVTVEVVGTGSMYPSLYWDESEGGPENPAKSSIPEYRTSPQMYRRSPGVILFGRKFLEHTIAAGDMVAFSNDQTKKILDEENKDASSGFIKRVIGVPGDTIELRDGYVYKNGSILDEPYIYRPRSTYGGTFLPDCEKLIIPAGEYFVLGDNRKVSSDSRFGLGLVSVQDISFVLPLADQGRYRPLWRDSSTDAELSGTLTLVPAEFYQLASKLRPNTRLAQSSSLRGQALLKNKNTPFSLKQAADQAGYHNVLLGEFVSYGHFTAEELWQNLLAFPSTATQIKNPDYQDIGIASLAKEIGGCPTQIIVGHLGGYIPATYDPASLSPKK